ncbi:MAG TPA: hypothetical protein VGC41_04805 [Kofleriaceae bacterium]
MVLTELERKVIETMLADEAYEFCKVDVSALQAYERDTDTTGFKTTLVPTKASRVIERNFSGVWSRGGGYLEHEGRRIIVGFLVFVIDGLVHAVEGYTYVEEWPADAKLVDVFVDGSSSDSFR